MKKSKLLLGGALLMSIVLTSYTFIQQKSELKQANATTLYESVLPIFYQNAKRIGADNTLAGEVTKEGIKFYSTTDKDDWIMIHSSGDSLFTVGFYWNQSFAVRKGSSENLLKCIAALTDILPCLIGYDATLEILTPFFDEDASAFYLNELEKAEDKMCDIIFDGMPNISGSKPTGNSGSKLNYTYFYNGPGNWSVHKIDESGWQSIHAPFVRNNEMGSCASISIYDFTSGVDYTCGLFGCTKGVQTDKGWEYTQISFKEFKNKAGYNFDF